MRKYFSLVTFSHTIFAMPFAFVGLLIAYLQGLDNFPWSKLLLVIACMVFARSAAMAFNRYLDKDIDAKNPRTKVREIPSGVISPKNALLFVIINCLLFIFTTYFINITCFLLAPVALIVVLGYSYTKRVTPLCHFVLGIGLGLAPLGAYIAVSNHFDLLPILYSLVVLFWVSGFDILYSLQDEEFDRNENLKSIPVLMGTVNAMKLSKVLHILVAVLFILISVMINELMPTPLFHWIGTMIFIGLLVYQHSLVKPNDLSKIDRAFFTTNGIASLLYATFFIIDIFF